MRVIYLMSRLKIVIIVLLLTNSALLAQGEANFWYFGENAGLDFGSGSPIALLDGQLNTTEGCATISSSNGALLFYTDGIIVWDKQHNVMPNGNGLLGDPSSTQSGIIVPKPTSPNTYYIFAVAAEAGPAGLTYSEVDLSLNGGNGDITALKNVQLISPTTEKITAIENDNGQDFWVVTHSWDSNNFLAYEITAAGVNETPIPSATGSIHSGDNNQAIGYMKISPDGKKLALAQTFEDNFVEIFDFDTSTGVVSNPIKINGIFYESAEGPYGIEFSPDNNLLYISDVDFANTASRVHQLDITFNNAADIINSDTILYEGTDFVTAIQLAPDGKIYVANANIPFLDVIENPNELGVVANYGNRAIDLDGRNSIFGLPPFIQSFFNVDFEVDIENLCLGFETNFTLSSNEIITSVLWDFGDGTTSTDENPAHVYAIPGTYTVTVTVNSANNASTITQEVTIFPTPITNDVSNLTVCDDPSNDMIESFDLSTKIIEVLDGQSETEFEVNFYDSFSNAENDTNSLSLIYTNTTNNQEIFVRIHTIGNTACFAITSFTLIVAPIPIANEVPDIEVCNNDNLINLSQFQTIVLDGQLVAEHLITYHLSQADADTNTNPLPTIYQVVTSPQEIFVRIEKSFDSSCFDSTSFDIALKNCEPIIPEAFSPNNDGINDSFEILTLLDTYEAFVLKIYNRYGILIYEGGNDQGFWNGMPNKGLSENSKLVPTGTYFYVLELNDPQFTKPFTGYIYVNY